MTDLERTTFRTQFGFRLRECRKRQRYTQIQLSKEIGVTNSTIWQWEKGIFIPNLEHFARLLKTLDVKAKVLLPPV